MRTSTFLFLLPLTVAFAQGPRAAVRSGSGLDLSKVQTMEGAVTSVSVAYGAQYPSVTVNSTQIKLAPIWYLLDNDMEIAAGDTLRITAAPSALPADAYWSALIILNTKTGATLTLRSPSGVPLWKNVNGDGMGRGNSSQPRAGTGLCSGASALITASGIVDRTTSGAGIQFPSLALNVDGVLLTVKIGPEKLLLGSDFEIKPGDRLTVKYAVSACTGDLLALQLTNAPGITLVLRNDDCTPAWN